MKLQIFTIFDAAAKAHLNPLFLHNEGQALRTFQDAVNSPEPSNISTHSSQFTLFHVGEYDDETGKVTPLESIRSIVNGLQLKDPEKPDPQLDIVKHIEELKTLLITQGKN